MLGGVLVAAWAFTAARSYTMPNIMELVVGLGQPVANANETLEKTATIAAGSQVVVIWAGRGVVILATVMALLGAWRSWRVRGLRVTAILLMVLPGMLVLMTGFGGEVLFRAFLFAAPFIAFLAAAACLPRDGRGFPWRNLVATALLTTVLLPGFLLSYYGKERQNYFTPAEVTAVTWVQDNARPGSLLVEGSRNYPTQFKNYEKFTYVPIDREPEGSWRELLADPVDKLDDWLEDPRYTDAYILITRSQKIAVDTQGSMPIGSLEAWRSRCDSHRSSRSPTTAATPWCSSSSTRRGADMGDPEALTWGAEHGWTTRRGADMRTRSVGRRGRTGDGRRHGRWRWPWRWTLRPYG